MKVSVKNKRFFKQLLLIIFAFFVVLFFVKRSEANDEKDYVSTSIYQNIKSQDGFQSVLAIGQKINPFFGLELQYRANINNKSFFKSIKLKKHHVGAFLTAEFPFPHLMSKFNFLIKEGILYHSIAEGNKSYDLVTEAGLKYKLIDKLSLEALYGINYPNNRVRYAGLGFNLAIN